jgi:ATP-dependent helicase/DNAse subunit B
MDKFSAVWVSHSSLNDFIRCPRGYYLKNVYKDPKTRNKLQVVGPSLSLGQAVHEVVESLSVIPTADRFRGSLMEKFEVAWEKVSGNIGGFTSSEQEHSFKMRGEEMIRRVMHHPGPLAELSIKIKEDLPYYWLSESDGIILCGKIDWLQYLPDQNGVHIIDFKTSKSEEDPNSLQLPIYHLLVKNCQQREVLKASYWYLEFADEPQEQPLPSLTEAHDRVLAQAQKVKTARKLNTFSCPQGEAGCQVCRPFEAILRGEGELVVTKDRRDHYLLERTAQQELPESEIL